MGVLQRFPNISSDRFAQLKLRAKDFGLILNSDTGSTTERGFTINWKYNPDDKTLEIQCTKKPFLVPWSAVHSKIAEWVEA